MGKPKKTRFEIAGLVLDELKARHSGLETVLLHQETGWRCYFVWNIEAKLPPDDICTLRSQADVTLAKIRERFEIIETDRP